MGREIPRNIPWYNLPPPYDCVSTLFPPMFFRHGGEPCFGFEAEPLEGGVSVTESSDSLVFQVVPWDTNPYVLRYGKGDCDRRWVSPEVAFRIAEMWSGVGLKIPVYSRRPGVRAAGIGRGRSRFLCGGGVFLYVAREVGVLPSQAEIQGSCVAGMVLVWGASFPCPKETPATFYLVPSEYLLDAVPPGLPRGLSSQEEAYWLPPPPEFNLGPPDEQRPDLFQALVVNDISEKEEGEGGGAFMNVLMRGESYFRLALGPSATIGTE